jgi:predicted transcriptional regulator
MTHVTSFRIDDKLRDKLETVAQLLDRPQGWVISEALAPYLDDQLRLMAEAKEAVEAADADPTRISHEDIVREFMAKIRSK